MITGIVTADLEAIIRVSVRGPNGDREIIEAVIDTGFDGCLSLPPTLISRLKLPWRRRGLAMLADGSETIFDIHEGTIRWGSQSRRISVDSADTEPLIGMALLVGYELRMKVRRGGKVVIKPLVG